MFGGRKSCGREDVLEIHVTLWWFSLIISDYPAKFDDHRPFGRGKTNLPIFHVIPGGHVVRESCDIMHEFPSP